MSGGAPMGPEPQGRRLYLLGLALACGAAPGGWAGRHASGADAVNARLAENAGAQDDRQGLSSPGRVISERSEESRACDHERPPL